MIFNKTILTLSTLLRVISSLLLLHFYGINRFQVMFNAVLENACSELGARMSAMDSSSRNAGEMLDRLTLTYNRCVSNTNCIYTSGCLLKLIFNFPHSCGFPQDPPSFNHHRTYWDYFWCIGAHRLSCHELPSKSTTKEQSKSFFQSDLVVFAGSGAWIASPFVMLPNNLPRIIQLPRGI